MSWVWAAINRQAVDSSKERGAVLPLAVAAVILSCIAAALAIDIGFLAQDKRTDQKVADLAALDAVRNLDAYQARATASATRNGFAISPPKSNVVARRGILSTGGVFTVSATGPSIEVTVTSPRKAMFPFVGNKERTVTAVAVATAEANAGFSIGSKLASLSTTNDRTLINRVFSGLLGVTPALNGDLLSYKGLAATSLSLRDLVAADATLGSPEQLLNSNVTVRQLVNASAAALGAKGDAASLAARTFLLTFANSINSSLAFDFGKLLAISQPADPAAATARFNVYDLITGAAMVANKSNTISIPNIAVGLNLGVTVLQSDLRLHVIEGPKFAYGPARAVAANTPPWATVARTAQVGFDFDLRVSAGVCPLLCATLTLPMRVAAAKAVGALTQIDCASPPPPAGTDITKILTTTDAVSATAASTVTATVVLPLTLPLMGASTSVIGSSNTLTFSTPPVPTATQTTAANGLGLATLLTTNLGLLGLPLNVLGILTPVTQVVDDLVLAPVFRSLGLSFAGADVQVVKVDCQPSPTLSR